MSGCRSVELIDLLEKKEKQEEDLLKEGKLTHEQAKQLFIETAGVIRALMDLKDLQKSKMPSIKADDLIRRKVSETKKWNKFLDKLKKGRGLERCSRDYGDLSSL